MGMKKSQKKGAYIAEHVANIEAQLEAIDNTSKGVSFCKLDSRCRCVHRDRDNNFALKKLDGEKSPYNKEKSLFYCTVCKQKIDIYNGVTDPAKVKEAQDTLNSLCDIAKMQLNLENMKDRQTIGELVNFQYQLNTLIDKSYKAISGFTNKPKKKKNPNQGIIEVSR